MNDIVEYVNSEWEERNHRLVEEGKRSMGDLPAHDLKSWVVQSVDVNGDEEITKCEALRGFKAVVDDIDPCRRRTYRRLDDTDDQEEIERYVDELFASYITGGTTLTKK